jgi:hypothetical protein
MTAQKQPKPNRKTVTDEDDALIQAITAGRTERFQEEDAKKRCLRTPCKDQPICA